jgi:hypothetical protein
MPAKDGAAEAVAQPFPGEAGAVAAAASPEVAAADSPEVAAAARFLAGAA